MTKKRRRRSGNTFRHSWEPNNGRENDFFCRKCNCRKVTIKLKTTYINAEGQTFRFAPECQKENAMSLERINTDTEEGRLLLAALGTLIMQPILNIGGTVLNGTKMSIPEMLRKIEEVKDELFKTDCKG